MARQHATWTLIAAALVSLGVSCRGLSIEPTSPEINRERAIEIARSQISYQPDSVDADRATTDGLPVWRVTIRGRLPGQPPGLFETTVVEIDRRTGEVISISRP